MSLTVHCVNRSFADALYIHNTRYKRKRLPRGVEIFNGLRRDSALRTDYWVRGTRYVFRLFDLSPVVT